MKKLLIFSVALLAAISCDNSDSGNNDEEVVIETLQGSEFSLSQFGVHTFPATDTWVIDDLSATTADFAGISAAIEYISSNDSTRQIEIEFSSLTEIPSFAIFGTTLGDVSRDFSSLVSVSAPYVTSIGSYAFEYCDGLTSVDMPLVESVGGDAFRNCIAIESLNFPLATTIGYSAFSGCSSLSSISIPLVENLGDQAFRICTSLQEVELPSTTTIGEGAFGYCSSLVSVYAPEVLSIGANAFCDCEALTELYIPIAEEIGDYALISCSSLTSFTIPASVYYLGVGLFNDCTSMTEIVATNNDNYTYDEGILYNSDQSKALAALQAVVSGDLVLPTSVTELSDRIFYNCTELTSVELPSVTSVSYAAFSFCNGLVTVSLPAATTLQSEAFYDCNTMTTFSAPRLTTIEGKAFYNCDDLLDLSIATDTGVVLQSIDIHAFHSANITATVLTIGISNSDYIFYGDTLIIGDTSIEFDDIIITGNLLELAA